MCDRGCDHLQSRLPSLGTRAAQKGGGCERRGGGLTFICPLRMVVESTFSLVGSVGSMKACQDQLAIMSSITCSISG